MQLLSPHQQHLVNEPTKHIKRNVHFKQRQKPRSLRLHHPKLDSSLPSYQLGKTYFHHDFRILQFTLPPSPSSPPYNVPSTHTHTRTKVILQWSRIHHGKNLKLLSDTKVQFTDAYNHSIIIADWIISFDKGESVLCWGVGEALEIGHHTRMWVKLCDAWLIAKKNTFFEVGFLRCVHIHLALFGLDQLLLFCGC